MPLTHLLRRARPALAPLLTALASLLFAASLSAHAFSVSYAQWDVAGREVRGVLRLPLDDIDLLLHLDADADGTITANELTLAARVLSAYVERHVQVEADGARLPMSLVRTGEWTDKSVRYLELELAGTAPHPVNAIRLRSDLLIDLYPSHKTIGAVRLGARSEEFVLGTGSVFEGQVAASGVWSTVVAFLGLGIEHILTGYDHVLFLLGLVLVSTSLRSLIGTITAFTIAHSITLALATLGIVSPVTWVVEASIALTIAYVGLENLLMRRPRHRWSLTFAFGLVHGFGFAAVLRAMHLSQSGLAVSLASFNAGVEMGQIAIVSLVYPAIVALKRTTYRQPVVRATSGAIAVAGLIWFVQRLP